MKEFLKNVGIWILVLILTYFLSLYFGNFYIYFFPQTTAWGVGDVGISDSTGKELIGLPLCYTFFLFLLFTAFGGTKKYWWIGIAIIPAAIFEIYFDLSHIYFPILLGLAGLALGLGISKILRKNIF